MPFTRQTHLFARTGRYVYLPHYLDVTKSRVDQAQCSYGVWAQAVLNTIAYAQSRSAVPLEQISIVGYSLGGSVALCVAAQKPQLAGVVVWSGSLPDAYRQVSRLPPLLILHGANDKRYLNSTRGSCTISACYADSPAP